VASLAAVPAGLAAAAAAATAAAAAAGLDHGNALVLWAVTFVVANLTTQVARLLSLV